MRLEQPLHFFLGTNSPSGFIVFNEELTEMSDKGRLFILKGGPGAGKSTLLRAAARSLSEKEPGFEYIHCSSDPDSLDGVIFPQSGTALTDGTLPHAIEPRHPGVCETIVDFCTCWDEETLQKKREPVLALSSRHKACQQQCVRFLNAAHSLLADNESIALSCTDSAKIIKTAANIMIRECHRRHGPSVERRRFLYAVTPKGIAGFPETIRTFPRVYYIKDPYGASSGLLLSALHKLLSDCGVTFFSCFDPLNPQKIAHLLIPELGLAFVTGSAVLPPDAVPDPYRVISWSRFTDRDALSHRKQRLRFNRRAAEEILDAACRSLQRAKTIHDALEAHYAEAMDFSAVQLLSEHALNAASKWQTEHL